MTSEGGCSVQIHLWLRKEDRGQVVLETKCAARPPPACSLGICAHRY